MNVFLLFDDYTYDGEREDILVTPCISKEVAEQRLKERWEWYKKKTYISQFFDNNGNLIEDMLDDACDECDVTTESVDFYCGGKDTSLSLYIVEKIIVED